MIKTILLLLLCGIFITAGAQSTKQDTISIAFWNLENLFDTKDDPKINDQEFLPESERKWDNDKFNKKLLNQSAVIRSMNFGRGPDLLGVCEVENAYVLRKLSDEKLADLQYQFVHFDSPDERGIDVALLFRSAKFKVLDKETFPVFLPDGYKTRDILMVILEVKKNPTEKIAVLVNHWPSRRQGQAESDINRVTAAATASLAIAKMKENGMATQFIIMGDFNDEPLNTSIISTLGAKPVTCDSLPALTTETAKTELLNFSYEPKSRGEGSYKYRDDWNMLDQIIISRGLVLGENFQYVCGSFEVVKPYFLVQKDGRYAGTALPTFGGRNYLGGYSDHFPVMLKITSKIR